MDRHDLLLLSVALLGIALVALGAGMAYRPAGPIAAGTLILAAVWVYLRGGQVPDDPKPDA